LTDQKIKGRELKKKVQDILLRETFDHALEYLTSFPARQIINPLFSLFLSTNPELRWTAVTAMGEIVSRLADEDMESARVVMRRMMWNLNDESGGIGWGCPDAMGEIMALHGGLAKEYVNVLISYAREDGNYLEYEPLQRGLLWGIGRLATVRAGLLKEAGRHIIPFLKSVDPTVRGLAAWVVGILRLKEALPALKPLLLDEDEVELFHEGRLVIKRVKELAEEAEKKIRDKKVS